MHREDSRTGICFAVFFGPWVESMRRDNDFRFSNDAAIELMLEFAEDGTITYANAAAMQKLEFGEELCGARITDIFPNDFKPAQGEDSISGSGEKMCGFVTEFTFGVRPQKLMAYRKNLTCFAVEARILRTQEDDGYLCMAVDISEKEFLSREVDRVSLEAQEAMKVKSEFVANVTHELRTPVNGILGNTRELLNSPHDAQTVQVLQLIERCCGDMNKIINNILDFSKLEAGKFTLEIREFDFRNMLDYVKASHLTKITEKGLEFFMTVSPEIPECIIGDELRIVQILNNLLSNAAKFTSIGKISVEVVKTAQVRDKIELFFFVVDTGIGIDADDQDKLFQSFSQVDASISRRYGGTGLGLNICKQLVELMDGSINVESVKNRGTTFSFSIWVKVPEAYISEEAPEELPAFTALRPFSLDSGDGQEDEEDGGVTVYGSQENMEAIRRNLSKLILCVEMENQEKAEMFVETLRQLTAEAPKDVKTAFLRLKMAIQKGNYEKTAEAYEKVRGLLE